MTTAAHFRKLALSMPETEERSHFEQPDFRVNGKIFCGLSRDGASASLKLTPELQAMVTSDAAFTPAAGAWGRSGWTMVALDAVALEALVELVREAWRIVAPKKLLAENATVPKPAAKKPAAKKPAAKKPAAKKPAAKKPAAKKKPARSGSSPRRIG